MVFYRQNSTDSSFGPVEYELRIKTADLQEIIEELDTKCVRNYIKESFAYAKSKEEVLSKIDNKNDKEVKEVTVELVPDNESFGLDMYSIKAHCVGYTKLARILSWILDANTLEIGINYCNKEDVVKLTTELLSLFFTYEPEKDEEKGHNYSMIAEYYIKAYKCFKLNLSKIEISHYSKAESVYDKCLSRGESLAHTIRYDMEDYEKSRKRGI